MLGYWWGVLGVIMVPQSDLPPKPLGATVPQSSLFRWKWAPKLKPLPLHSSKALDSYFWAQSFLGVDKLNHKKKSKISENRLNRLVNYIRLMVLMHLEEEFLQKEESPSQKKILARYMTHTHTHILHGVWKSQKKSHSICLKTWSLLSNSVTRQVSLKAQKSVENAKIEKFEMRHFE